MDISFKAMQTSRADYGSQFEILVAALYAAHLKADSHAIDGGANSGLHAVPMAQLVPQGHLYCFEPNPTVYLQLAKNLASSEALNQCSLHAQALSSRSGFVEFMVNDETPALSHIRYEADSSLRPLKVPAVMLDNVIGGAIIDFIKLDLEGADFLALLGARNLIERSRPVIVFENSRSWAAQCYGYAENEFFQYFDDLNYMIYDLHGRELTPEGWSSDAFGFEFVAAPRNDDRCQRSRDIIQKFWHSVGERPVIETWTECVLIARKVREYLPWL